MTVTISRLYDNHNDAQQAVRRLESAGVPQVVSELEREFKPEIIAQNIERVWAHDNIVIIAVVGSAIKTTPGVAARVFSALADQNINVIAIAQGSSEYNLSLVVDETTADNAVRAIHHSIVTQ